MMKRLILDRGFLDGEAISKCKEHYGIEILIPFGETWISMPMPWRCSDPRTFNGWSAKGSRRKDRRSRIVYDDAPGLLRNGRKHGRKHSTNLKNKSPRLPEKVLIKKEAAAIGEFRSWSSCTVPLSVVANREQLCRWSSGPLVLNRYPEGEKSRANPTGVSSTGLHRGAVSAAQVLQRPDPLYLVFSMVVNQVVFVMLAYNLLQIYLLRRGRPELNPKTLPRIRQQLLPSDNHLIVDHQNYYGLFAPLNSWAWW